MNQFVNYNYHCHTKRCGHAQGEDEEYVLSAIAHGFKVLGFSDHMMIPHVSQPGIRGDYSLLEDYVTSIKALKEKYKDQIQILLGFECEYFDGCEEYLAALKKEWGFDYFILGQHCYFEDNKAFFYPWKNPVAVAQHVMDLLNGMKSGQYLYAAHPDLYVFSLKEFNDNAKRIAKAICEASLEYDIPLEYNLEGLRHEYHDFAYLSYPCDEFWEIVGQHQCKVIVGVDAHNPAAFGYDERFNKAKDTIEKYHLNVLNWNK